MGADVNALVECLPSCWSEDRPQKYEPVTAAGYIDMRLNAIYVWDHAVCSVLTDVPLDH